MIKFTLNFEIIKSSRTLSIPARLALDPHDGVIWQCTTQWSDIYDAGVPWHHSVAIFVFVFSRCCCLWL